MSPSNTLYEKTVSNLNELLYLYNKCRQLTVFGHSEISPFLGIGVKRIISFI